jgi:hypothetical protein
VQDVVRHLCDVSSEWRSLLQGNHAGFEGFDPRRTPAEWLDRSADERPTDTIVRFEEADTRLLDEGERLMASGAELEVPFPYGTVTWSIIPLHAFWDAWVHERDILFPLGHRQGSPPIESRAAAVYGIVMSGVPNRLVGTDLEEVVLLEGDGGGSFRLNAGGGAVSVQICDGEASGDALRGPLPEVVDSMAGRGPQLSDVLAGPKERVDRLALLRRFMMSSP